MRTQRAVFLPLICFGLVGCEDTDTTLGGQPRPPASDLAVVAPDTAQEPVFNDATPDSESDLPPPASNLPGTFEEVQSFGSNPGKLRMHRFVPAQMPQKAALVVALHGCNQTAADFAKTGWNTIADQHRFFILYPETNMFNQPMRCFNFPTNLTTKDPEVVSIFQMIDTMRGDFSIDPKRIFIAGVSAGAAMTVNLLGMAPGVFAAGGSIAGVPFHCGSTVMEYMACGTFGKNLTPAQWAGLVWDANPGYKGLYPRISIWQGSLDTSVNPVNSDELVEQWTEVHGIDQIADAVDVIGVTTHKEYRDASGATLVETYTIGGAGHMIPVDPKNGCGSTGMMVYDKGICAADRLARFFGLVP
jgi:poly(hydroxyalkanoate) depolymerase family esterase